MRCCVYCGGRTHSPKKPLTCPGHKDLPSVDPHYGWVPTK